MSSLWGHRAALDPGADIGIDQEIAPRCRSATGPNLAYDPQVP